MGINIFEQDEDFQKRKNRFSDDVVGRFRSGRVVNRRPMSLEQWRVTSGDPEVLEQVRRLLGGTQPAEWETSGEDTLEVDTEAATVDIIIDGPDSIRSGMVLFGRNGLIRSCDGITQRDDARSACACPQRVADRKEAAKAGTGCEPSIQLFFSLADDPELGRFKFSSGSWGLAEDIGKVEKDVAAIDSPAAATLSLEVVEYTTKGGQDRRFVKPVIKVTGPAPA